MMKVEQQGKLMLQEEDYSQLSEEFRQNKDTMMKILKQSPKVGAYAGQSQSDWQIFFAFFMGFLRSEIGPRGQCAKQIRQKLISQEDSINKVLAPFQQTARTHIREIYMKCKNFVPCQEYVELLRVKQARQKFQANLEKFRDKNSLMLLFITDGLIKKHGADFDVGSQIKKLEENYVIKIEQNDKIIQELTKIVENVQSYHDLMKVKEVLQPYFKQWTEADSMIGKQNCKTGQLFEEKVFQKILPYIMHRQKSDQKWKYSKKQLLIFTNVNWIPKSLGQIDIALGYKDQISGTYHVVTLIQCKSRLFDLREAYMQVSLENQPGVAKGPTLAELKQMKKIKLNHIHSKKKQKNAGQEQIQQIKQANKQGNVSLKQKKKKKGIQQQNEKQDIKQKNELTNIPQSKQQNNQGAVKQFGKKFLSTKYGPAELVQNHHFYIITTLPQNHFVLPIESKMKESIQKHNKNLFVEDIQSDSLYKYVRQRFENLPSPLDWITHYQEQWKNEDSNIIVLQ